MGDHTARDEAEDQLETGGKGALRASKKGQGQLESMR